MRVRLLALAVMLAPALAWACPYCSLKPETHRVLYALGAMIFLPWVVGATAIAIIRRLDQDDNHDSRA
jgi:hypothetical protein